MSLVVAPEDRIVFVDGVALDAVEPGFDGCVDLLDYCGLVGLLSGDGDDSETEEEGGDDSLRSGLYFEIHQSRLRESRLDFGEPFLELAVAGAHGVPP